MKPKTGSIVLIKIQNKSKKTREGDNLKVKDTNRNQNKIKVLIIKTKKTLKDGRPFTKNWKTLNRSKVTYLKSQDFGYQNNLY